MQQGPGQMISQQQMGQQQMGQQMGQQQQMMNSGPPFPSPHHPMAGHGM